MATTCPVSDCLEGGFGQADACVLSDGLRTCHYTATAAQTQWIADQEASTGGCCTSSEQQAELTAWNAWQRCQQDAIVRGDPDTCALFHGPNGGAAYFATVAMGMLPAEEAAAPPPTSAPAPAPAPSAPAPTSTTESTLPPAPTNPAPTDTAPTDTAPTDTASAPAPAPTATTTPTLA